MIETANEYLRLTNKYKPALLEMAGSNLEAAQDIHGLFGVFGTAMSGKSAVKTLSDTLEKAAQQIPPNPQLFDCVAELFFAATA